MLMKFNKDKVRRKFVLMDSGLTEIQARRDINCWDSGGASGYDIYPVTGVRCNYQFVQFMKDNLPHIRKETKRYGILKKLLLEGERYPHEYTDEFSIGRYLNRKYLVVKIEVE